MNAFDLDYVDQKLVKAANTGVERAKDAKTLEAKLEKLKVVDRQINRRLQRIEGQDEVF